MTDILGWLIQGAVLALLAIGGRFIPAVSAQVAEYFRLKSDAEVRDYLTRGLELAVQYGQAEARRRILGSAGDIPRERQAAMAAEIAHTYARERWPEALARFGVDDVGLTDMLRARMPAPAPRPFGEG